MNLINRILWVYDAHTKLVATHNNLQICCHKCAFFADPKNFKDSKIAHFTLQEKMKHFMWGLCGNHLDMISEFFDLEEKYFFEIERELGVYEEGYFRTHPDGRCCSIHSPVWKAYLLSLCES